MTTRLNNTTADPNVVVAEHPTAPVTPETGHVTLYGKGVGYLFSKDDTGTEILVSGPQVKNSIDVAEQITIMAGYQLLAYQSYQVDGTLINDGTLVIL